MKKIDNEKLKKIIFNYNDYLNSEYPIIGKYYDKKYLELKNKKINDFNASDTMSLKSFTFEYCKIKSSNFVDILFEDTTFNFTSFSNINFTNSYFESSIFRASDFQNVISFKNTNLSHAVLNDCRFIYNDKDLFDFSNSNCSNVEFRNCILRGINFSNTNLSNANFIASSIDLSSFYIDDAILTNTDFTGVDWFWHRTNIENIYKNKIKNYPQEEIDAKLEYIKSKGGKNINIL